ncbi:MULTISPECIES: hypothetical protein [Burkholderia]|uniref:Uncharacterized protein n=1 Tax=Burkholderia cenocepacia TaxID=95486 RepID=A0ABD4UCJ1_9BURK|nr:MULTISPECIES: hypothetical protein [Burkholderia]MCW3696260.1 hypothetical protein [Burkholderia cenocepacia]MCW3704521.1 hypothetical protein [Burkholderia cenocepacia]MCW3712040.1 hypothetical protein [Burkholderia cenocepacia]MCW3720039.1 hypothetical protein [Burkholderia cenocepacia]MCW3727897.1 hypothetical protein [Burkholderia cenocepacia]
MAIKTTKRAIHSVAELNQALVDFAKDIMSVGASSKGDHFDETVRSKLIDHLPGAKYVHTESFCAKEKDSIYFDYSRLTTSYQFDFTHLPTIVDNGKRLNLMIVDKPNGSQKWPDLLVIYNGIGFPIEVKSSKKDGIVWNSGIPRSGSLYVFNCYGLSKTTCFLGQHAITEEELDFLNIKSKLGAELNEKFGSRWSFYVRDMYNSNQSYFENEVNLEKAQGLEDKVYALEDKLSNTADPEKILKLKAEIDTLYAKYNDSHSQYMKALDNRVRIEGETLNYLRGLSWDTHQRTDFNTVIEPQPETI